MRRPATPLQRLAAALPALAAVAAVAGCSAGSQVAECPGAAVGTFRLVATRTAAACQGDAAPADGSAACLAATPSQVVDCQAARPVPPCCFDGLFPPALPAPGQPDLVVAIAYGPQEAAAAVCLPRPKDSPLLGTHAAAAGGDELAVSLDTSGAVYGACAAACAVTVHQALTGLLARDPVSGAATGFTGQLVEVGSATAAAACAPCAAPCTATWAVATAP